MLSGPRLNFCKNPKTSQYKLVIWPGSNLYQEVFRILQKFKLELRDVNNGRGFKTVLKINVCCKKKKKKKKKNPITIDGLFFNAEIEHLLNEN